MTTISKTLTLDKKAYYETHLSIINGVLPKRLTQMEIEVLAAFMALEGDIINAGRFCTSARKIVKADYGLSDGGLGNYLRELKNKGYIFEKEKVLTIRQYLIPDPIGQEYNFKLIRQ